MATRSAVEKADNLDHIDSPTVLDLTGSNDEWTEFVELPAMALPLSSLHTVPALAQSDTHTVLTKIPTLSTKEQTITVMVVLSND